jgi:hypothetical protein
VVGVAWTTVRSWRELKVGDTILFIGRQGRRYKYRIEDREVVQYPERQYVLRVSMLISGRVRPINTVLHSVDYFIEMRKIRRKVR